MRSLPRSEIFYLYSLYNGRGNIYYLQNKLDLALKEYNQAITLSPKLGALYNGRGNVYYSQNRRDEALKDYNQAIRLDPTVAYAYYSRGLIYRERNQRDAAIADFRRARDLYQNPKDRQHAINRLKGLGAA